VKQAIKKLGTDALKSIHAELTQMHLKGVWTPLDPKELKTRHPIKVIRSSMLYYKIILYKIIKGRTDFKKQLINSFIDITHKSLVFI
jgi:hypothetical protein